MDEKKGIEKGRNSNGKNPFEILIKYRRITDFHSLKRNAEGEIVPNVYNAETDRMTKVYISSDMRKVVSLFSPSGKGLYLWLIYELGEGKDYIRINRCRYMRENGIKSINTYKKGIMDLMRNGFISIMEGSKDTWWINPSFFFNGSRIAKYKDRLQEVR